jgi:hypothetical protein
LTPLAPTLPCIRAEKYSLTVNVDGCVSERSEVDIVITNLENSLGYILKTYPNPVRTTLHIETDNNGSGFKTEIFDICGRMIGSYSTTENSMDIVVANYKPGIYTAVVFKDGKIVRRRIEKI